MTIIRLPKGEWEVNLNEQIGATGGFGAVYAGSQRDFPPLAIKKLKLTAEESANRELRIAEHLMTKTYSHVIPIFDAGQDAESDFYYVVMARAEKSLKDEFDNRGIFDETEAANILLQIVLGLEEANDIVHRDLKPGNILYHDNNWKIGDFGIAKFVEESTSLQTLKDCLSPQYAAPEQWNGNTVTVATDLYALGCIGYQLVSGRLPFLGNDISEYQKHHLYSDPHPLANVSPLMRTLITMLMRKSSESRPTLERAHKLLEKIIDSSENQQPLGLRAIASVGAIEAEKQSIAEAKRAAELDSKRKREELGSVAFQILNSIWDEMCLRIIDSAPVAIQDRSQRKLILGTASMELTMHDGGKIFAEDAFAKSKWNVICGASIIVFQAAPEYTWGASLWYTNQGTGNSFRWIESSYFDSQGSYAAPFALTHAGADLAHSRYGSRYSVATKPKPIDDEAIDEFIERWTVILAQAYEGKLSYPRHLPID